MPFEEFDSKRLEAATDSALKALENMEIAPPVCHDVAKENWQSINSSFALLKIPPAATTATAPPDPADDVLAACKPEIVMLASDALPIVVIESAPPRGSCRSVGYSCISD